MKDPLFQPISIGNLDLKNRIYLPAMHLNMASEFKVTDQIISFYRERAKGGTGLISTGYATIDDRSGNTMNIGAHKDEFIEGLTKLASAIRAEGSKSVLQLNHAGRYNFSFFIDGKKPVAPSPIASRLTREEPEELTIDQIKEIIKNFAAAAVRAKESGFDAIEILSGTGYLISEFLSKATNARDDEYGGSFENRTRFGLEVVKAVKEAVGQNYPLIIRMNGNDFMPGGQGKKELQEYAVKLSRSGYVDALCINVGWHEARVPQIVSSVPRGAFAYLAGGIKRRVGIPVIASHRINTPELARDLIADGMCDMVAMGRSLIADPFLPKKAEAGKENEIVHCIACAQGCFDNLFKLKHVECLCNPKAGYEDKYGSEQSDKPGKVVVVGGGAAGMSAAMAAHDRGHDVVLFEGSDNLGGQLHLAAAPPGREEFGMLATDLENQLRSRNIRIETGQEVGENVLSDEKPDHVILATGAIPVTPPIPGSDSPHVVQAWDVLSGRAYTGKDVVVIGGGAVGVEVAQFLAEKGTLTGDELKFLFINKAEPVEDLYELAVKGSKHVVIVEMLDKIGSDIGKSTRWGMMQDISRMNIKTMTHTKALEIKDDCLVVESGESKEEIKADTIVLAAGAVSYNPLESILEKLEISYRTVGDAKGIALAFDAVHQGFQAGMEI